MPDLSKSERRKLVKLLDRLMEHEESIIETHSVRGDAGDTSADPADFAILAEARMFWGLANKFAVKFELMGKP